MKNWKLFEAVSDDFNRNLEFLLSRSGSNEIHQDLKDIFTDLCEEFEYGKTKYSLSSFITLKYKTNKVNRKTAINLSYYILHSEPTSYSPSGTLNAADKRYVKDFLSKAESSVIMKLFVGVQFQVMNIVNRDIDDLCQKIDNTIHLLKSYGYDAKVVDKFSQENSPANEIKNLKNQINDRFPNLLAWERSGGYPYSIFIELQQDIDIDLFKPGNEYLAKLPEKIIADFKTFCDKFRMNSLDREELANLIQKSQS
jgi:uncharacterized protein (UPF0335 family)